MRDYDQHRAMRRQRYDDLQRTIHLTGVECPRCKENGKKTELHYTGTTLLISPPNASVECPECGFRGAI